VETARGDVIKRSVTFKDLSDIHGGSTTASLHSTNEKTGPLALLGEIRPIPFGEIRSFSVM
jgi:hypothetical protein